MSKDISLSGRKYIVQHNVFSRIADNALPIGSRGDATSDSPYLMLFGEGDYSRGEPNIAVYVSLIYDDGRLEEQYEW